MSQWFNKKFKDNIMSLCENIELRCNKLINGIILYKIIFNLFPYYNLMYKASFPQR